MPSRSRPGGWRALLLALAAVNLPAAAQTSTAVADHNEFDATLQAPFRAEPSDAASGARSFTLHLAYPGARRQQASWRLELFAPDGKLVATWHGVERLRGGPVERTLRWPARAALPGLPDGIYQLRLRAVAAPAPANAARASVAAVSRALATHPAEVIEQQWPIALGQPAALATPAFRALARGASGLSTPATAPAPGALPYTIYYANLHSQANHSDGGGRLDQCTGAHAPQTGEFGPIDAYQYAHKKGLDILLTSEHNHMYDGADGTNPNADPAAAKALYQSGLAAAAAFNAAHPDFLAVYGQEWGVINQGGHLNVLTGNELLGWEFNGQAKLLADTFTPKNDYAALYTTMRQRGWLGQFNHPASSGQFRIGSTALAWSADGDQAMALCEVLNTSAFSSNDTETETRRSQYGGACDKLLEAGFHLAFSSNQDNHCANWGSAYTNRTGLLIPNGSALSFDSYREAVQARRIFATMDKQSQLVLTANGHVMGERFRNSGPLTLLANFASASGHSVASATFYQGVPGRNGKVTALAQGTSTTFTPAPGEHFYYVKLIQDDGNLLWSAPVWVSQQGAPATPP